MTREKFIKKWLGAGHFYIEDNKDKMREDLDKVIEAALPQADVSGRSEQLADSALVCSGCLKKDGTVHRDMYDGLCADCTTKALYDYDFAKKAEKTNKSLKRHFR
jgi:hypothetical protein